MQTLHANKTTSFIDTSQSVMTKLLADSLAGNALTLLIGTFKQGELSESEALLKHLQARCVCTLHRQQLHHTAGFCIYDPATPLLASDTLHAGK